MPFIAHVRVKDFGKPAIDYARTRISVLAVCGAPVLDLTFDRLDLCPCGSRSCGRVSRERGRQVPSWCNMHQTLRDWYCNVRATRLVYRIVSIPQLAAVASVSCAMETVYRKRASVAPWLMVNFQQEYGQGLYTRTRNKTFIRASFPRFPCHWPILAP
jgi:hypothetical protein